MKELLSRDSYEFPALERRKLMRVVVAGVAVLVGWQALNGRMTRAAASSSLGCEWRADLIASGLRSAGHPVGMLFRPYMSYTPEPGWIAWSCLTEKGVKQYWSGEHYQRTHCLADGNLQLLVSYLAGPDNRITSNPPEPPVYLSEGSRPVFCVNSTVNAFRTGFQRAYTYLSILRSHEDGNEMIWMGRYGSIDTWNTTTRFRCEWRDFDDNGVKELLILKVVMKVGPGGVWNEESNEVVASFGLDQPGGILRTRSMTKHSGVIIWNPPSDEPVWIDADTPIETVIRNVLPPPDWE
jgi:hypothetical protein